MGVPVVTSMPLSSGNVPERILTVSGSRRWVVKRDCPGRRWSRNGWMSAALSGILGGQPSTTQPSATPWLSPKVVTRNKWPKVLWDMENLCARCGSPRPCEGQMRLRVALALGAWLGGAFRLRRRESPFVPLPRLDLVRPAPAQFLAGGALPAPERDLDQTLVGPIGAGIEPKRGAQQTHGLARAPERAGNVIEP